MQLILQYNAGGYYLLQQCCNNTQFKLRFIGWKDFRIFSTP